MKFKYNAKCLNRKRLSKRQIRREKIRVDNILYRIFCEDNTLFDVKSAPDHNPKCDVYYNLIRQDDFHWRLLIFENFYND